MFKSPSQKTLIRPWGAQCTYLSGYEEEEENASITRVRKEGRGAALDPAAQRCAGQAADLWKQKKDY